MSAPNNPLPPPDPTESMLIDSTSNSSYIPTSTSFDLLPSATISNLPVPTSDSSLPVTAPIPTSTITDISMDHSITTSSSSSSNSSNSSISASSTTLSPLQTSIQSAITKITSIGDTKKSDLCIKSLLKLLKDLKKTPTSTSVRKLRADNIAYKKNIFDINGSIDLLQLVGYEQHIAADKKSYIEIRQQIHNDALDTIITTLQNKVDGLQPVDLVAVRPAEVEEKEVVAVKKLCVGGCGFWGSAEQEDYCSKCFKTKHVALASATAAAKSFQDAKEKAEKAAKCPLCYRPGNEDAPKRKRLLVLCDLYLCCLWIVFLMVLFVIVVGVFWFTKFFFACFKHVFYFYVVLIAKNHVRCHIRLARTKLHALHLLRIGQRPPQLDKKRCYLCAKKVGITGFECRCHRIYCAKHR